MSKDLHKQPFDEGTKVKLQIFRDYLKEWLPVFLAKKEIYYPTINIFEFFAGPGEDVEGISGTPLIVIEELMSYHSIIKEKRLTVNLYFNEFSKWKYHLLQEKVDQVRSTNPPFNIQVESLDFLDAFKSCFAAMNQSKVTNLVFLDQSGIKHINEDIFNLFVNLKRTDFLFFYFLFYI